MDLVQRAAKASTGTAALLTGGTAKSRMQAVDALASELDRSVHRIDLSELVSKYLAETEESLKSLFDEAEGNDVVLFFDEGDALFGGTDEHGAAVGYLQGRMHARLGLSVLGVGFNETLNRLRARFDHVIDLGSEDDESD